MSTATTRTPRGASARWADMSAGFATVAIVAAVVLAGCSDADEPSDEGPADEAAVAALVEHGVQSLAEGDTAEAAVTFAQVLELDPDSHLAHYNLGYIDQEAGQEEEALDHYDEALEIAADFAPALFNKAILVEDDDLEEAVGLYERVIEAEPDNAAAHMRLGFALQHLGRDDEAEQHLEAGLALDPSMADVVAPDHG